MASATLEDAHAGGDQPIQRASIRACQPDVAKVGEPSSGDGLVVAGRALPEDDRADAARGLEEAAVQFRQ